VRAQLKSRHVICDRYLSSPLSLMIGESAIEEAEAFRFIEPFAPYLCVPDVTLLLTANHDVASARIHSRSSQSGKLTSVARRMLESKELFEKREYVSRRLAAKLGQLLELDTTNLSSDEMCHCAWSLLAPKLNW
jgi:thymidylate kinase